MVDMQVRKEDDVDVVGLEGRLGERPWEERLALRKERTRRRPHAGVDQDRRCLRTDEHGAKR